MYRLARTGHAECAEMSDVDCDAPMNVNYTSYLLPTSNFMLPTLIRHAIINHDPFNRREHLHRRQIALVVAVFQSVGRKISPFGS